MENGLVLQHKKERERNNEKRNRVKILTCHLAMNFLLETITSNCCN